MKIVFDFAGVLFGWHPPSLLRREIPARAFDEPSAAHWAGLIFQGYGGDWAEFDRGTVSAEELTRRIARRTGLGEAEVRRVVDGVAGELRPIEATVALLRRLREAGRDLYFLSNMPAPYAERLEALHPFVGWFKDGVFSARVGWVKPEPAIFDLAARRFAAAPGELLFFDDVGAKVDAARRAGWNAQLFTDAAGCEAELRGRGLIP
jgi:putative hydrolase of the HAD superfamily